MGTVAVREGIVLFPVNFCAGSYRNAFLPRYQARSQKEAFSGCHAEVSSRTRLATSVATSVATVLYPTGCAAVLRQRLDCTADVALPKLSRYHLGVCKMDEGVCRQPVRPNA
jgi:hypothetical protein